MLDSKLNLKMEGFASTGLFLNVEEQLILRMSLPVLQQENRFASTSFYGKIFCSSGDYYIALGRGYDSIRNKMFFYSLDGHSWRVLFPPSEEDLAHFRLVRNQFTGDATYVHRFHIGDLKVAIREETRLSAAVHLLDWETCVGPKGALQVDEQSRVHKNPYFKGVRDPTSLSSYVHHRLPKSSQGFVPAASLCPTAGDSALAFLEPIDRDYPDGCWLLRTDPVHGLVRLQSLWWPGHTFCSSQATAESAACYLGFGVRNDDLPFML